MIIIYELLGIKFLKQAMMRKVVYALVPIIIASIYFFGWRSIVMMALASAVGVLTEWIFEKKKNKPVSEAVYVTAILYTLTLPVRTPLWIVAVGMIFGIVFGKEVFGGFGRNVFNPALVGRAFVYVSFPAFLTGQWTAPFTDIAGGFTKFMGTPIDDLASATPMLIFRATGEMADLSKLFIGNISGSLGETSAVLILLAGLYLLKTKTASWETMLSTLLSFLIFNSAFYLLGAEAVPNPLFGLLSGGILFAAVFMATDPISSPKTKEAKFIYGAIIGLVTVVIRGFALFAGGVMFAILIGNTFAPILDETVKYLKKRKKERG
ncbi:MULTISPECIES: RnfABCDGE type electron transport complex subunit D [unclassified Fusibacter]|uniref:RnfABCDGE type electron transport complex subunit D n=1 Tax=unclassified Fusibacter TaxID=2624464 RepID=UPI001FAAF157|nr:RnfABCDGE type electron transport complex subunit D [Fusibacter sp. A1]MCK8059811.1 RnfABCDGE type electron transport complex subunit D [Fusibacter sp. A2]